MTKYNSEIKFVVPSHLQDVALFVIRHDARFLPPALVVDFLSFGFVGFQEKWWRSSIVGDLGYSSKARASCWEPRMMRVRVSGPIPAQTRTEPSPTGMISPAVR